MTTANAIRLRYALRRERFSLDVEAEIPDRGVTAVFGASGAGKTSLLRCIAGLERAEDAYLELDGTRLDDSASGLRLPAHRRAVAFVFQEPRLFNHLSVEANIRYGRQRRSDRSPAATFDELVEILGIEALLTRAPSGLSGGEAQRVAIARALMSAPRLVLMDEPLSALDAARRQEVLPFLERLHARLPVPLVYVSHQQDEVLRLADTLIALDSGRVFASGPLEALLARADVPGLSGAAAAAVLHGVAGSMDDEFGMTPVESRAGQLWVAGRHPNGTTLRLLVPARDVSVSLAPLSASSIQNSLAADIADVLPCSDDSAVLLKLDASGVVLFAHVTRRAVAQLDLRPGQTVFANVKSAAVRPVFAESPPGPA